MYHQMGHDQFFLILNAVIGFLIISSVACIFMAKPKRGAGFKEEGRKER